MESDSECVSDGGWQQQPSLHCSSGSEQSEESRESQRATQR